MVFYTLRQHRLFLKCSKCFFRNTLVAYLSHVISLEDVTMDPQKVNAVMDWPQPSSMRAIQAFIGIAAYYCKFIQGFSILAVPLTKLLMEA